MRKAVRVLATAAFLVAGALCLCAEPIAQLRPSNYVNDFAGVLDAATQAQLNDLCREVDERAKAQIAVVTVKSTDGEDVVNYAVALYQKWGIGKKGTDRGVLILLAVEDKKYWTAVGYGLEPILPDGKVGGFGREAVPLLRNGDDAGAVSLMTQRVASVIAQDVGVTLKGARTMPRSQPVAVPQDQEIGLAGGLVLVAILIFVVWLLSRGGRGRSGGGGSGFASGLLWGILLNSGGRRGGYGGGWGGGGFGGGGGGFGGFGGGSTGGGGAGGSW